ncbi:MAG: DMT family transporter [Bacteroidota bacterium]
MVAFAANSVLARLALVSTDIDAASFTAVRVVAGALVLVLLVRQRGRTLQGSWRAALALFVYAAAFSFAYLDLSTGTGALLLFGAVQVTMVGAGLAGGERMGAVRWLGSGLALAGLVVLVAPGVTAPPPGAAALMAAAGVGWGAYSLAGRGQSDPIAATAGNFARGALLAVLLAGAAAATGGLSLDPSGVGWAVLSGAVTSGLGYVAWYAVLPSLRAASAATVQLSVPVLAALGGVAFVSEPVTLRLAIASVVTLGGIALVVRGR